MADMKISDLPAAPGVNDAQQFEVNDSGNSRRVTFQQVHAAIKAQADVDYAPKTPQHQGAQVPDSETSANFNALPNQYPYTGLVNKVFLSTATNQGPPAGGWYYLYHFFHFTNVTQLAIPYAGGPLAWRYYAPGAWSAWQSASVDGHTHTAAQISDGTWIGRALMTTTDPAYARSVIGAGTSNLTLGYSAGTAKPGHWAPNIGTDTHGYLNWDRVVGVPAGVTLPAALGVGSYMLASVAPGGGTIVENALIAGSQLRIARIREKNDINKTVSFGGSPVGTVGGTWRNMSGRPLATSEGSAGENYYVPWGLFMRIA